jgi:hypothetical protein
MVRWLVVLAIGLAPAGVWAQEAPVDHSQMDHAHMHHAPVVSSDVVDLELARNASGTAWQPETTPHLALHTEAGGFMFMFHTALFGGYDWAGSNRGDQQAFGAGWVMGMARRRIGRASIMLRAMLSPEEWTAAYRQGGYPLLLQTGETYGGQPLHDRQHAHDLFMEVGALYTQGLTEALALQLYAAPAGEPALGPIAFPHRWSAGADPLATLSHHWQDSTHISFGVLTAGVIHRAAKLEGSWFNGREPDEDRHDFDLRRPDSYAVRLSVAPAPAWSGQISYGHLASPEALLPGVSVQRFTASAMYDHALGAAGHWAALASFGANKEEGEALGSSFLVEANVDLDGSNVVLGRVEAVQKAGHDLVLAPALDEQHFLLSSLAVGYLRNAGPLAGFLPGLGARATVDLVPASLDPVYGGRLLLGAVVYARVVVAPSSHAGHAM